MITGTPSARFELISELISDPENTLSVKELCELSGVSRSGFYSWKASSESRAERECQDRQDFELILKAWSSRKYPRGAKGIHMALLHEGIHMNLKKIRRLMKKFNLVCSVRKANPYRRMAKALKTSQTADNLVQREFEDYGPRTVLLTDITYLYYSAGNKAYLSTVIDGYSKEVLAWQISTSLEIDFVLATVNQLIENHGSELKTDAVIHSDQGAHYTSHKFSELVKSKRLRQSMSRRGNCWDNAPQESFFGHMKDDIKKEIKAARTFHEVKEIVNEWIEYYNHDRYQWDLAKLAPCEFYRFVMTGEYPIKCINAPAVPEFRERQNGGRRGC